MVLFSVHISLFVVQLRVCLIPRGNPLFCNPESIRHAQTTNAASLNFPAEITEAETLDLTEQEMALFRIIAREQGMEQPTTEQQEKLLEATVEIFAIIRERASIVDFFRKDTEVKALKTEIKHSLIKAFGAGDVIKVLMDRLTEQSKVFFK